MPASTEGEWWARQGAMPRRLAGVAVVVRAFVLCRGAFGQHGSLGSGVTRAVRRSGPCDPGCTGRHARASPRHGWTQSRR